MKVSTVITGMPASTACCSGAMSCCLSVGAIRIGDGLARDHRLQHRHLHGRVEVGPALEQELAADRLGRHLGTLAHRDVERVGGEPRDQRHGAGLALRAGWCRDSHGKGDGACQRRGELPHDASLIPATAFTSGASGLMQDVLGSGCPTRKVPRRKTRRTGEGAQARATARGSGVLPSRRVSARRAPRRGGGGPP